MSKTLSNWKETECVGITAAGKHALEQTAMKLTGDYRVEPNSRDAYNRVRSWKLIGRDGKRIVTTVTKSDAMKLIGILTEAGL